MDVIEGEETVTAVPCLRYTGVAGAKFHHPEGVCACFRGGPGPVQRAICLRPYGTVPAQRPSPAPA